ncbi:hypothetical protein M2132_002482 [Dysgonomonas sp. PH5-45]|nr:hypothetical protein [Dysgonomonas sp. PH5-45]MDH6389013.1 hypothetical protein [Dysgonomonas sp. PH5-37]
MRLFDLQKMQGEFFEIPTNDYNEIELNSYFGDKGIYRIKKSSYMRL